MIKKLRRSAIFVTPYEAERSAGQKKITSVDFGGIFEIEAENHDKIIM